MTADTGHLDTSLPGILLIDAEEVARRLGVSNRTVWRLNSAGKLPRPVVLGRSKKWEADEIGRWVDASCPHREAWEALLNRDQSRRIIPSVR